MPQPDGRGVCLSHNINRVHQLTSSVLMLPGGELIETISRADVFGREVDERMKAFIQGKMVG